MRFCETLATPSLRTLYEQHNRLTQHRCYRECYFKGNLVGLHLDSAINSVNVVDCNFENNRGLGVIVNSGAMVRIEGSEFESQGGPAILAQNVRGLTLRSNCKLVSKPLPRGLLE